MNSYSNKELLEMVDVFKRKNDILQLEINSNSHNIYQLCQIILRRFGINYLSRQYIMPNDHVVIWTRVSHIVEDRVYYDDIYMGKSKRGHNIVRVQERRSMTILQYLEAHKKYLLYIKEKRDNGNSFTNG